MVKQDILVQQAEIAQQEKMLKMVLLGNMVQPVKMIIQLKWSFYLDRPCIPVGPFFKIRPFVTVESFYVYTPLYNFYLTVYPLMKL